MLPVSRSYTFAVAGVIYVAMAVLRLEPRSLSAWFAGIGGPFVLAAVWRSSAQGGQLRGEPLEELVPWRAVAWGSLVWLASRGAPLGREGFIAAANLGTLSVLVASLVALARIPSVGGLLAPPKASQSLDAAAFAALLGGIAAGLPLAHALLPTTHGLISPVVLDFVTATAALASLLVHAAASARLWWLRRIELGVGERATATLMTSVVALLVCVPATLLDLIAPDRALPAALIAVGVLTCWAATSSDPARVAQFFRASLVVLGLGAPTVLVAVVLTRLYPAQASFFLLMASGGALLVGVASRTITRRLSAEQHRWLEAIEKATDAALLPSPDEAIRASLAALAPLAASPHSRAELWRLEPPMRLSVDVAGNLHEERGLAPSRLAELALDEPERTVRTEALAAVQVRRPEVRDLTSWLQEQGILAACLLQAEDGPVGLLCLPGTYRRSSLSLDEVRSLRRLSERLASVLHLTSAHARARARELCQLDELHQLERELVNVREQLTQSEGAQSLYAERLDARLRRSAYSPAARMALVDLEAAGRQTSLIRLCAPPGVDTLCWAAVAHRAGSHSQGHLLLADAQEAQRHPESWLGEGPTALMRMARGGTLVVLGALALPSELQAAVLSGTRPGLGPDGPTPPHYTVILELPATTDQLRAAGGEGARSPFLLEPAVEVRLPALMERSEDLRALFTERLAALSLGRGRPLMTIDSGALLAMLEHPWPHNDVELEAVLARLATEVDHDIIGLSDLDAIGFQTAPFEQELSLTPPPAVRRRAPGRSNRPRER